MKPPDGQALDPRMTESGVIDRPLVQKQEARDFKSGDKVLEHYVLDRSLGAGGMGAVWLAHHDLSHQKVAIKILRAEIDDEETRARFILEAKTLATLDHPKIVPLLTFAANARGHFLVMKFIDGETLEDVIARGPVDFGLTRKIVKAILVALQYAHKRGVIHRDIKPGNILISKSGEVFLADFGIARQKNEARVTQAGILMGTPLYLSPEQIGGDDVDGHSDLYSLGAIIHEMLTGKPPFDYERISEILSAKLTRPVTLPEKANNEAIPNDLRALANDFLLRDPAARPDVEDAIARLQQEQSAVVVKNTSAPPKEKIKEETKVSAALDESLPTNPLSQAPKARSWPLVLGLFLALAAVASVLLISRVILKGDDEKKASVVADADLQEIQNDIAFGRFTDAARSAQVLLNTAPDRRDLRAYRFIALAKSGQKTDAQKELAVLGKLEALDAELRAKVESAAQLLKPEKALNTATPKDEPIVKKSENDKPVKTNRPTKPKKVVVKKAKAFSASMITNAAKKSRSASSTCFASANQKSVDFELTIKPTGRVSSSKIKTKKVPTSLSKCLRRVLNSWKLPPFEGATVKVRHTFKR